MMRNFLLALLVFVSSCRDNNELPEGVLKPEKMKLVLMDVIKAEAYTAEILKTDTTKNGLEENSRLQQQVFSIHKVSKEEFYRSFMYYKEHAGVFKVMLDSMVTQGYRNKSISVPPTTGTSLQAQ
jgi:Domain of unknown function (DUF4296)